MFETYFRKKSHSAGMKREKVDSTGDLSLSYKLMQKNKKNKLKGVLRSDVVAVVHLYVHVQYGEDEQILFFGFSIEVASKVCLQYLLGI